MQAMVQQAVSQQQSPEMDPAIQRAMALLVDGERPTFPIEVIDPDPKKFPIFRVAPATEAITDQIGKKILVNRKGPGFSDDTMLAALLAHEQEHARRNGQPDQYDEGPAYQRQYDVLARLKYKNLPYMKALKTRIDNRTVADNDKKGKK